MLLFLFEPKCRDQRLKSGSKGIYYDTKSSWREIVDMFGWQAVRQGCLGSAWEKNSGSRKPEWRGSGGSVHEADEEIM